MGNFLFDVIIGLDIEFQPGPLASSGLNRLLDKWPEMFEKVQSEVVATERRDE